VTTCYWQRGARNMGDMLTPVILAALGKPVAWASKRSADMIACGSIIDAARAGTVVWGSGAMSVRVRPHPQAVYRAVRGPVTREIVRQAGGECPAVYGDPALLLPTFHNAPITPTHTLGIVPHHVDEDIARARYGRYPIISPVSRDPLAVVDRIRQCSFIASSSLHGLIVAQAYGIPFAWLRLSDRLVGDGTKFVDFAASVGVDLIPHKNVADASFVLGAIDTGPLRAAL
jgi:pyruvyltransferase